MKKTFIFFLLLIFSWTLLVSNNYIITGRSTQTTLNILKVSYFDPSMPLSQPLLFNLDIQIPDQVEEDVNDQAEYKLFIEIFWNGNLLTDTTLEPIEGPSPSHDFGTSFTVTNRDLITAEDNRYFVADGNFSFDDVIDNNEDFKDFLLDTGLFPDGSYRIDIELRPDDLAYYSGSSTSINFTVRGIQSVRLISPGVLVGSHNIPEIFKPIIFNWTTSGINNSYVVEIKEFDQEYELDPSNLEFNGRIVEEGELENRTVYQPEYSFQEGKYYAWRTQVKFVGEETLNQPDHNRYLSSNYNVFKFACAPTTNVPNAFQEEFENNLKNLNIAEINSLLEAGYFPKDGINLNGKTYYGKEAVDKLRELFSTYTIEVSVE